MGWVDPVSCSLVSFTRPRIIFAKTIFSWIQCLTCMVNCSVHHGTGTGGFFVFVEKEVLWDWLGHFHEWLDAIVDNFWSAVHIILDVLVLCFVFGENLETDWPWDWSCLGSVCWGPEFGIILMMWLEIKNVAEISAMQCGDFGMISLCIGFCALCSCSLVCFVVRVMRNPSLGL